MSGIWGRGLIHVIGRLAVALTLLTAPAAGQAHLTPDQLTPEQLEILKSLSPEEREELLRSYGLAPETAQYGPSREIPTRDTTTPDLIAPREEGPSRIERELTAKAKGGPLTLDDFGALADSLGFMETRKFPVTRPDSVTGAQPLTIDAPLEQFGYDLFAGTPTTFAPATDVPVGPDYIIGPGDEIRVQLYGKSYRAVDLVVDRDGMVPFPELGPISIAGMTFTEMKDSLTQEVENRMVGTSVNVTMRQLRSMRVFVLGEVFRPGATRSAGFPPSRTRSTRAAV